MTDVVEGLLEGTLDTCVHCGHSTAFGSGRYVNRIPVDDGWGCAECSGFECDRCAKPIYLDADVTADQCDFDAYADCFLDGAVHVHEACLTATEGQHFRGEVFTRSDVDHTTGGCLKGYVELVPARLVEIFGAPDDSDGHKTSGEYIFTNSQGDTFHLYDWKSTVLWEDGLQEVDALWSDRTLFEFNVGGNSNANAFIAWITKETKA
jgi:hypothetical protein